MKMETKKSKLTKQEIIEKAKKSRENFSEIIEKAIENSLTTTWQSYNDFTHKVRIYCNKDLEWITIGETLNKWIEKKSQYQIEFKNDKPIKNLIFSPVEWKNANTDDVKLRKIKE